MHCQVARSVLQSGSRYILLKSNKLKCQHNHILDSNGVQALQTKLLAQILPNSQFLKAHLENYSHLAQHQLLHSFVPHSISNKTPFCCGRLREVC
uniref:Uncharacterized protein n=1 Tax=Arundo donax TaxID=35708 RepID=A0A0A9GHF8_ARUDO